MRIWSILLIKSNLKVSFYISATIFENAFWLRIIDAGSIPEMRIWTILYLLIKSDLKWCIHVSRSLYWYFNYLVNVTAGGPVSPRDNMWPSSTVDFSWFVAFESIKIFWGEIVWNCNFVGLSHHPVWLQLVLSRLGHLFSIFEKQKGDLTQSYDKSPYTNRNVKMA